MQHHDGARCRCIEAGQHAVKIHAAFFGIVIGIGIDLETGVGEQSAVVFPAGIRNQYFGVGADFFQEVGTNFEAACATDALHGGHAAGFNGFAVGAKNQAFDCGVVGCNAVNGQVTTGRRLGHHGVFCGLHAFEQGEFAVVVEINAHTQIHLVGVGIGCKLFVQTQNRVAGGHFDGSKQRHEKVLDKEVAVGRNPKPRLGFRVAPNFSGSLYCFLHQIDPSQEVPWPLPPILLNPF